MRRVTGRFEGLGCLGGVALALAIVGVLALFSELQSPTSVLWTGHTVIAQDRGGVVQYAINGVNYTLVITAEASTTPQHPVTVYYDPAKPNLALPDNQTTRWFDASFVGVPFLLALAAILAAAARARRRRKAREAAGPGGGFGQGFDPAELRHRRRRVANPWADPPDRPA